MRQIAVVLLAGVLLSTMCLAAETVHHVRPGSHANGIALEVINRLPTPITALEVDVAVSTEWIRISGISSQPFLDSGSSATVMIEFGVLASAGKNEEGEVTITISSGGTTLAHKSVSLMVAPPNSYRLAQNYPNPCNPSTTIEYELPNHHPQNVTLRVYDLLGREVATLVDEAQTADYYKVEFHATTVASGVYFYRIQSGPFVETKRFMVLK